MQAKGRKLWREFHAVPGAWISLWILALLITGLPWAIVWGGLLDSAARKAGGGFPAAIFEARPASVSAPGLPDISMSRLIAIAHENGAHHGFKIDYPWWEGGSYALLPARHAHDSMGTVYLFLDRRDGKVLDKYGWKDLGKVGRLTSLGVAFHEGRLFGIANQFLNLAAVLLLIAMCVTGPVMWRKRKPQKALGAPGTPEHVSLSKPLIGMIVLLGILLPLFGLSALLIWLGDTLMMKWKERHAAG